jgi:hypothetical protein
LRHHRRPPLTGDNTAIDHEIVAIDEARGGAGEVERGTGDIVGQARAWDVPTGPAKLVP